MATSILGPRDPLGRVDIVGAIRSLWRVHAPLTLTGLLMGVLTLFFIAGIFVDGRVITGAPAWLKPTKFGISITLYTLTLTWMLGFVDRSSKWKRRAAAAVAWVAVVTFAIEMTAIVTQVVRGTTSHFNAATPFDATVVATMGITILVLWVANFVTAILLLAQRFESRTFGWGLRLGLLLTIVGMGLGFLMTDPTAQQLASWQGGEPITVIGAHSVGVPDGGEGMPVTGWSTEGGDLRIGHFVGMHALQVVPFVGWFLSRRRRLSPARSVPLTWIFAAAYAAIMLLLTWQALRAQPLVAPDAVTAGAFLSIVLLAGSASLIALRPRLRRQAG
ncbi:MAG TPA: hypothetical protein VF168_12580 [Trueperaceae bacterium]